MLSKLKYWIEYIGGWLLFLTLWVLLAVFIVPCIIVGVGIGVIFSYPLHGDIRGTFLYVLDDMNVSSPFEVYCIPRAFKGWNTRLKSILKGETL